MKLSLLDLFKIVTAFSLATAFYVEVFRWYPTAWYSSDIWGRGVYVFLYLYLVLALLNVMRPIRRG